MLPPRGSAAPDHSAFPDEGGAEHADADPPHAPSHVSSWNKGDISRAKSAPLVEQLIPPFGLAVVGIAGVYAALWAAAKVFRVGLLMYGKPPNLPTLWRWVRQA